MSGPGTNIGIEYQQKVSAWFALQFHLGEDVGRFLRAIESGSRISELRFEAETPIDDLVVALGNGSLYLQIKHSLSLSDLPDSEFVSVVDQFVRQHLRGNASERYLLITSSISSRKVRLELNNLLDSIRLGDADYTSRPTTASEAEVLDKFRRIVERHAQENSIPTEKLFVDVARKVHVVTFDIEAGQPMETATFMQIAANSDIDPRLIWSNLVLQSLEMASRRMCLTRSGLSQLVGSLFVRSATFEPAIESLPDWFQIQKAPDGSEFRSGVEYLFTQGISGDLLGKYCLLELKRFDKIGAERLNISNGVLHLAAGHEFRLIYRCSTITRARSLLGEWNKDNPQETVHVVPGNFDTEAENTSVFALARSAALEKSLASRLRQIICSHCVEFIAEKDVLTIESNTNGQPVAGYVHRDCLMPNDRIIGHIPIDFYDSHSELRMFDFELWATSVANSMNTLASAARVQGHQAIVAWDDTYREPRGEYCFAFLLSDGSKEYVHVRSKIDRSPVAELDRDRSLLVDLVERAKARRDPYCCGSVSRRTGNYSFLVQNREPGEQILEVEEVLVERFSLATRNNFQKAENFYAPIFYVESVETNLPFRLGQYFVLLTDPFDFRNQKENWERYGESLGKYRLVIVHDDRSIDQLLGSIFSSRLQPILDPLVGDGHKLLRGVTIERLSELVKRRGR